MDKNSVKFDSNEFWLNNECKTTPLIEHPIYKKHPNDRCCIHDQCHLCELQKRVHKTNLWFSKFDSNTKQRFLIKLIALCNSIDILDYLIKILNVIETKDAGYVGGHFEQKRKMNPRNIEFAEETCVWFAKSKMWTKTNFLLSILSFVDPIILRTIRTQIQTFYAVRLHILCKSPITTCYHLNEMAKSIHDEIPSLEETKKTLEKMASAKIGLKIEEKIRKKKEKKFKKLEKLPENAYKVLSSGTILYTDIWKDLLNQAKISGDFNTKKNGYLIRIKDENEFISSNIVLKDVKVDFSKILPLALIERIFFYLEIESLTNCAQIGGSFKMATESILRRRSGNAPKQQSHESQMMIPQLVFDLDPDFEQRILVSIPQFEIETAFVSAPVDESDEEYSDLNKNIMQINPEKQLNTIMMRVRNVYCNNYTRRSILTKLNSNRIVHHDGCDLIAIAEFPNPIDLFSCLTMKKVNLTLKNYRGGSVRCLQVAHREKSIFVAGHDGVVRCWDIPTSRCKNVFVGHKSSVSCLAVYGNRLAAGSIDGTTKVWNYSGEKYIFTFNDDHPVTAVALSEFLCLTGCKVGKIRVYDVLMGVYVKQLTHKDAITSIRANRYLISSSSIDTFARVWSTRAESTFCLRQFAHPSEVTQSEIYFFRVITGCSDGKIRIWDLENGRLLKYIYPTDPICCSPILSFHLSTDWIIVNTEAEVVQLNFGPICRNDKICLKSKKTQFKSEPNEKSVQISLTTHGIRLLKSLLKNAKSFPDPNTPPFSSLHHLPVEDANLALQTTKRILKNQKSTTLDQPVPEPFYSIISRLKNPSVKSKSLPKSRSDNRLIDPLIAKEVTQRAFTMRISDEESVDSKSKKIDSCAPIKSVVKSIKPYKQPIFVQRKSFQPVRRKIRVSRLFTTSDGECEETVNYMWTRKNEN